MTFIPKAGRARWQRDFIRDVLHQLDDATIDDLLRRAQHAAVDEWSRPANETGRSAVGGIPRPTEQAAVAHADPEHRAPADPVLELIAELFALLASTAGVMRDLDRKLQAVQATADHHAGREVTIAGSCRACTRPVSGVGWDKLRLGFCNACRMAFARLEERHAVDCERAQRVGVPAPPPPDRDRFARERQPWQPGREEATG